MSGWSRTPGWSWTSTGFATFWTEAPDALEQAVALSRGDLLEGFAVRDAPDFEDWVRGEAEVLRRELTTALAGIATARISAGDLHGAIQSVQRWLALDPLHEPAHRP